MFKPHYHLFLASLLSILPTAYVIAKDPLTVTVSQVQENKAVFATIEPVDITFARARVTGTIDGLMRDEGDHVERGDLLAVVVDEKQPLEISALAARIHALEAQTTLAKTELTRMQNLRKTGVVSQSDLDEAAAKFDVLNNETSSLIAQRELLVEKLSEAKINSPTNGRILKIFKTNGSIVQAGENIASIAVENYILRLTLPERHAQSLKQGGKAEVLMNHLHHTAQIHKIYPLIENGIVTADLLLDSIGDYFVGQRVMVYIPVAQKEMILLPNEYIQTRHGLNYVTLDDLSEIVVQTGATVNGNTEVLSGLNINDKVIIP